jgi:outer membrane lipoprotein SlyB
MKYAAIALSCAIALSVSACAPKQGQNVYKEGEVGISRAMEYGTVRSVREVQIEAKNTGIGTLGGAGIGAGAGSYVGGGSGNAWATAGAAVVGAVVGTMAESAINDRKGLEYTVTMQSGETKTIVQEMGEGEVVFKPGQKVALQYCDRGEHANKCADGKQYQRLLPVDTMPAFEKKRRKIVKG